MLERGLIPDALLGQLFILAAALTLPLISISVVAELPVERQGELIHIVKHDCGSCHGMTLKGGLGPPLTSTALIDKPPSLLINTIKEGHAETAMPPWKGILNNEEITWLVEQLQAGIEDYQ